MSLRSLNQTFHEGQDQGWMARLLRFWDEHQRTLLGVLGAVVAVGIIGFFTLRAREQAAGLAAGKLAEASVDFWQGNYQRSLSTAQQVSTQYGGTSSGADALRLIGDNNFWLGNFKDAIASYRKYLEKNRTGVLADAVRRSLANSLESDRQLDEAARLYTEVAGRMDRESAGDCLMGAARCHRTAGRNNEAAAIYRRVVNDFGETTSARMARIYLAELTTPKIR